MEIIHTQKYLRISPQKLRGVALLYRKENIKKAIDTIPFVHKSAARALEKIFKAAFAIARENGMSEGSIIKEIQIGEGPRYKRGMPVSRGRWHPIIKRTSHVRIVLAEDKKEVLKDQKIESKQVEKHVLKKGKEKKNGTKS